MGRGAREAAGCKEQIRGGFVDGGADASSDSDGEGSAGCLRFGMGRLLDLVP